MPVSPYDASGFVLLTDAVPDAILEIRYHSTYNFVGARVDGYAQPCALITREAAAALRAVSDEAVSAGLRLKIYDVYRPQRAVDHFVRWAADLSDDAMKPVFYPDVDKTKLFDEGFIARRSGHSRGSTVDLTLVDALSGRELDMGGPFDFFGELSYAEYTRTLTPAQIANRRTLRELMMGHGFRPLRTEWWHFTLEDEPYPDTYFDFEVSEASVK